jgi:hypothetical protein
MLALLHRILCSAFVLGFAAGFAIAEEPVNFQGMCDASAAAAIDAERFIVADDEENILRVYERSGGPALGAFDVSKFLGAIGRKGAKEADIEGGAQLGARTFWITSHGRNAKAQEAPERQRIFATEVRRDGDGLRIEPVGRPYALLLEDLLRDKRLVPYRLGDAALLAPKAPGGLNIEGLAATPEGHLLIGFRNPLHEGRALVVPLLNPREIIDGARARLGEPNALDLGGRGIRSLGYSAGRYLIIAGSPSEGGGSRLFEWKGSTDAPREVPGVRFRGLNPEGVSFHGDGGQADYFVLSDDGATEIDGRPCKDLKDPTLKRFRGRTLKF